MSTATEIDLQPFCKTNGTSRYQIDAPFVIGGKMYATNGSTLIEVPADGEPDTDRSVPKWLSSFFFNWDVIGGWMPFGDVQYQTAMLPCGDCEASGFAHRRKCDRCDGDGEINCCECRHKYDCPNCKGKGEVGCGKCPACNGAKERMQPHKALLGGLWFAHKLLEPLRALPDVEYAVNSEKLFVRFAGGGRGVAMPLEISR